MQLHLDYSHKHLKSFPELILKVVSEHHQGLDWISSSYLNYKLSMFFNMLFYSAFSKLLKYNQKLPTSYSFLDFYIFGKLSRIHAILLSSFTFFVCDLLSLLYFHLAQLSQSFDHLTFGILSTCVLLQIFHCF